MGRKLILLVLLGLVCFNGKAAHLVGGDFSFICQGNNFYDFNLTIYRDAQSSTGATHDNPAYIFVTDLATGVQRAYSASLGSTPFVENNDLGPCLQNPAPPVLDFATYRYTNIELPPNNGRGYRVVYQRCCRSGSAQNLAPNFDGNSQGSTYEIIINAETINSCDQPGGRPELKFEALPPTQWCADQIVSVSQSVNSDILSFVDSVVYSLCAPLEGGSGSDCIIPDPFANGNCFDFNAQCDQPCSYGQVAYNPGYDANNPMGANSSVVINPQTGLLTVNPNSLGIFVVAICATAYKDGQVYNEVSRDFSFKVFDCLVDGAGPPEATNGSSLGSVTIDSIGVIEDAYLICSDSTVTFNHTSGNNVVNYYWDFGVQGVADDTSLMQFPTYTYPDTGTYLVTFVVNRGAICVDTAYGVVRIFPKLEADFTAMVGCFTKPVEFTDVSISTLDNNSIVGWNWDFGDGNTASGSPLASHTYDASQTYTPQLTIQTELGCVDSFSMDIFTEPSPTAGFGNLRACSGSQHLFENLSELNGTALDMYSWDFGNGAGFSQTSTNSQPDVQVYPDSGLYTIQLAVSSLNGCSDTARATLVVADQVVAGFVYDPSSICPGQEVQFTHTVQQYYDSLKWNIDGMIFTEDDPLYTFTSPGPEQVDLIVYSNTVCGDSTSQTLVVEQGPFATFEVDSTCTGSNFTFINNSMENGITIDSFVWDFGDGTTGVGMEPVHVYQNSGDFVVTMIAMTNLACKDTTEGIVPVKDGFNTDFSYGPDTLCEGLTEASFTNLTTGGTWDYVTWNFGDSDTVITAIDPDHLYFNGGFYTVTMTVVDDVCGENDTSKVIEILDIPQPDIPDSLNICDGVVKTVTVNNEGNYEVTWSSGQMGTNSIQIDNQIDSLVVEINNRGCVNSDLLVVKRDCPAFLPNTFTPNGDGVNDRFAPLPFNITSFTIKIFNRWGEMVYSSSTFEGWDGTYKGDLAPMDTYVYTLDGIGLDNKTLKQFGSISLLR